MTQQDEAFVPSVVAITLGSTVEFPNADPYFHNVFSLSWGAAFDLGRYPRGQSRHVSVQPRRLDQGVCHLHSHMAAAIMVFDHQHFTVPEADGSFALGDVPAGEWRLSAWHGRIGETVAFEALARWNSPELGRVAPGVFIPVAERTGLIGRLTIPLLGKALCEAQAWPEDIRLSFNLSALDCGSHDSVQQIIALIQASGFEPSRLDLEITETAIVQDIAQMQRAIIQFRQLGCGISLDDFGTGYSSLSQLHALSLTKLKIDRSFVAGIQHNPATFKIVKSLVGLTLDMGLECVIEGVETHEELAALTSLGCTQVRLPVQPPHPRRTGPGLAGPDEPGAGIALAASMRRSPEKKKPRKNGALTQRFRSGRRESHTPIL